MCDVGCNKLGVSAEGRQDARHDVAAGSQVGRLSVNRASMTGRCVEVTAQGAVASSQAPPWPKNRLRIRPTDARLVWGLSARNRASDSLKPSGAHLATKARYAPIGDRTRIRLWGERLLHVKLEQSCEPSPGVAAHEVLGT